MSTHDDATPPSNTAREAPHDNRRQALEKEYGEVANTFRLLTDIRFKLLAFLPIAAAAAAALRSTGANDPATAAARLGFSLFGLAVTIGLVGYNIRNDQLYNELVGRAAAIERELGLPDGAFANRPNPAFAFRVLGIPPLPVAHGESVALIYIASAALWIYGVAFSAVQIAHHGKDPGGWVAVAACAGGAAALATAIAFTIRWQRKRQDERAQIAAAAAMRLGDKRLRERPGEDGTLAVLKKHDQLVIALCAGLLDARQRTSRRFRKLCEGLEGTPEFVDSEEAQKLADHLSKEKAGEDAQGRKVFYGGELARDDAVQRAYLLAHLTDLPPRWILDCGTGRRTSIKLAEPLSKALPPPPAASAPCLEQQAARTAQRRTESHDR